MNKVKLSLSRFFATLLPTAPVPEGADAQSHMDVTIPALWRALVRGWRFILFCVVIFALIGIALCFLMQKKYSVTMRVTPPLSDSHGASSSSLGIMSSLLGRGSSGSLEFNNFLELLHSNSQALALNADPKMRHLIYGKLADQPEAVTVRRTEGFLKGHITTLQNTSNALLGNKGSQVVTLTSTGKSPEAAMALLKAVTYNADSILRTAEERETQKKISYLQNRLKKTSVADYRDTLIQMISRSEQKEMLIRTSDHYAYFMLDIPVMIHHPFSPKKKLNVLISILFGLMLSILFILIRDGRRGALR